MHLACGLAPKSEIHELARRVGVHDPNYVILPEGAADETELMSVHLSVDGIA